MNPQDLAPGHSGSVFGLMNTFGSIPGKTNHQLYLLFFCIANSKFRNSLFATALAMKTGFLGVYLAGHILELTQSWSAVFSTAALINMIGWTIFTIFGSAQAIV